MLDLKVQSWWNSLNPEEQNVLISLLFKLELSDYVVYENETITGLQVLKKIRTSKRIVTGTGKRPTIGGYDPELDIG